MADFVKIAKTNEIQAGEAQLVYVKGKEIALFNVDDQSSALDNTCTHEDLPLVEGEISGYELTYPGTARSSTSAQEKSSAPQCTKPSRAMASA